MIMRILLLNPPTRTNKKFIREGRCTQEQGVWATLWPPVTLATTGAVLEREGYDVRICDCPAGGMSMEKLYDTIRRFSPDCVIWSTGTPSLESDLQLAADIKEIDASIVTAVFGTHVTVMDRESLLGHPALDYVIRNEPEITVRELVRALKEGKSPENVEGLTCRDAGGEVVRAPDRPFLKNLDELPFPAWHLFAVDHYTLPLKGRRFLIVAPQRGCPFNCSFCTCQTYYGKKLRKRSVERVLQEIEHDMETFKVLDFFFWAETFVLDREYVASLCRGILERGLRIAWTCNSRVDIVDKELLDLMRRAGCWMISFGIESADQAILDGVDKGIRVEQIGPAVQAAREAGIKTAGHFIFGLPGETEQTMNKTLRLAKKLEMDIAQFYCCVPFPGSRLYDMAGEQGWIDEPDFGRFSQAEAILRLPSIEPQAVDAFRSRAYREYYSSVGAWLRVFRMFEWGGLMDMGRKFLSFLRWSG